MYERAGLSVVSWLGVAVWAAGFGFEAVGDEQLRRFKADPANAGRVLDRGLWRYTRHPNYFGDAVVWFGFWLLGFWLGCCPCARAGGAANQVAPTTNASTRNARKILQTRAFGTANWLKIIENLSHAPC